MILTIRLKIAGKKKSKKAYIIGSLILMVLALIIILLYLINHLGIQKNIVQTPSASVTDTLHADTLQMEITP